MLRDILCFSYIDHNLQWILLSSIVCVSKAWKDLFVWAIEVHFCPERINGTSVSHNTGWHVPSLWWTSAMQFMLGQRSTFVLIHSRKKSPTTALFTPVWETFAKNYRFQLFYDIIRTLFQIKAFVTHFWIIMCSVGTNGLRAEIKAGEVGKFGETDQHSWFWSFLGICWQQGKIDYDQPYRLNESTLRKCLFF